MAQSLPPSPPSQPHIFQVLDFNVEANSSNRQQCLAGHVDVGKQGKHVLQPPVRTGLLPFLCQMRKRKIIIDLNLKSV